MVRLPQNAKQKYRLNSRPQMWPSALTLAMTLTMNFTFNNGISYISAKNDLIATKPKANISTEPQMWPSGLSLDMTLTLNFQGQIWNLPYLNQKCIDCLETKSKHMDWTPGLKCDQWIWPWPWPWHSNFQVQIWPSPLTRHMTETTNSRGQILK